MTRWQPAYVGLGSNLGDSRGTIGQAVDAMRAIEGVRSFTLAPLYRTAPFGPVEQPDFVNTAAGFVTTLAPLELFERLRGIERALGRERTEIRWGPRTIDLDLLVHGRERVHDELLTLPHPGIAEREFVLAPLADLAPSLDVPGAGSVSELLARVSRGAVARIA